MLKIFTVALTFVFLISGCRTMTEFVGKDAITVSSEPNGKGIVARPTWLKHKRNTIDILTEFTNEYTFPVVLKASSVTFSFNGKKAGLRNSEGLELAAGAFQNKLMIFDWPTQSAGGKGVLAMDVYKEDGTTKLPSLSIELPVPANEGNSDRNYNKND